MPNSTRMWSFARIALFSGIIVSIPLVLDQLVVRNLYMRVVEPESTAGTTVLARDVVEAEYRPDMRNVLVIGDSRIGEGFSPVLANQIGHPHGINFVRLGLAGTTPRVWHYVLRQIDPQHDRFVAVYLMAAGYRDDEVHEDFANRALDTAYLAPMLEWRDLFDYPSSFSDEMALKQARLAVAFPESALHRDLVAFVSAPRTRVKKALVWHQGYPNWLRDYPGRPEAMPSAPQPFAADAVLASRQGRAREELADYFRQVQAPPIDAAKAFAYRSQWYGRIAASYAQSATAVNVFLIPRGPYHAALNIGAAPSGALANLADKHVVQLMPAALGTPYEHPEFFFDHLHLNAKGRTAFSKALAEAAVTQTMREDR